jgi:glycogen(starch) synthase
VAEVLPAGALKCDFWDTRRMANQIVAVLKSPELAESLRRRAREEIRPLTWDAAARKCRDVYLEALRRARRGAKTLGV